VGEKKRGGWRLGVKVEKRSKLLERGAERTEEVEEGSGLLGLPGTG